VVEEGCRGRDGSLRGWGSAEAKAFPACELVSGLVSWLIFFNSLFLSSIVSSDPCFVMGSVPCFLGVFLVLCHVACSLVLCFRRFPIPCMGCSSLKLASSCRGPVDVATITIRATMLPQSQEVATWKQAAVCKEGVAILNNSNGKKRTVSLRPSKSKHPHAGSSSLKRNRGRGLGSVPDPAVNGARDVRCGVQFDQ
jgi:hypothetical protein